MADGPEITLQQLAVKYGATWPADVPSQRETLLGLIGTVKGADFVQVRDFLEITKNESSSLVRQMVDEREMGRKPWKDRRNEENLMRKYAKSKDDDRVCRDILELSSHQAFSMDDVMALTYSVWGDNDARRVQAAIYARTGFERVRSHNFFVAQDMDENWWAQFGPVLMVMSYPLFPMSTGAKEINSLNATLLRHCEEEMLSSKGAGRISVPNKVYREGSKGGDYVMPVTQDVRGHPIVNATEVQEYCLGLQAQVVDLRREIGALRGSPSRITRPPTQTESVETTTKQRFCGKCGQQGHFRRNCPLLKKNRPPGDIPPTTTPRGKPVKCQTCGGEGTHAVGCPDF